VKPKTFNRHRLPASWRASKPLGSWDTSSRADGRTNNCPQRRSAKTVRQDGLHPRPATTPNPERWQQRHFASLRAQTINVEHDSPEVRIFPRSNPRPRRLISPKATDQIKVNLANRKECSPAF
jgi:hypothetical protein